MSYKVYDQLVIFARLRHLNGEIETGWIGRWDWFMGVCHGGIRHWLDQGDGIDWWGRVMGARDWIGVMGLICGGAPWGAQHWSYLSDVIDLWGMR